MHCKPPPSNEKKRAECHGLTEPNATAARTILGVVASELGLEGDHNRQMDYTNAIMALEEP